MENIIETCKSLDYSWLPPEIGNFKLKVTGPDEIVKAQNAAGAAAKKYSQKELQHDCSLLIDCD